MLETMYLTFSMPSMEEFLPRCSVGSLAAGLFQAIYQLRISEGVNGGRRQLQQDEVEERHPHRGKNKLADGFNPVKMLLDLAIIPGREIENAMYTTNQEHWPSEESVVVQR